MSINWWTDKYIVVYSYNGILLAIKLMKYWLIHATMWMNLENIMLSAGRQPQKTTYYDSIYMKSPEWANL